MQVEILLLIHHWNLDIAAKILGGDLPLLLNFIIVHMCILQVVQPPP